jgi:hypothetical protein
MSLSDKKEDTMFDSNTDIVLAIQRVMNVHSAAALKNFLVANKHMRGAEWADVLAILWDSDANLDITEPLWDELVPGLISRADVRSRLITPVALTLHYAGVHEGAEVHPWQVQEWTTTLMIAEELSK